MCASVVEDMECTVGVMGERCSEEVATLFLNFLDGIKTELECENGLFGISRFVA